MTNKWIEIQTPNPHSETQRKIMEAFLNPNLREIIVNCGTKYGKTLSGSAMLCAKAPLRRQGHFRWIAPIYGQAKFGMSYCRRMLPPTPWTIENKTDATLHFPAIETQIQFCHGQNPESLEGAATHANVIDEAAKQKYEVYASVKTTTTQTGGPIAMLSTPKGKNWFYDKAVEAMDEMARAAFENREPRMLFITAPTSDNPFVPRQFIEDARNTLPKRLFQQYFLAEFVDDGDVFQNTRECVYTDLLDLKFGMGGRITWQAPGIEEMNVVIGADWGRNNDKTSFFAIDIKTAKVVALDYFWFKPYTDQVKLIYGFAKKFKSVSIIFHDKTGIGIAIDDMMAHIGFPYQGIIFSNASKTSMVSNLITAFEQRSIFIPNWSILLGELDAFEVKTTAVGNMTFGAPSGKHDDTVCSLMLAWAAFQQYGFLDSAVRYLEDLPNEEQPMSELERYYKDIKEDDDD